MSLDKPTQQEDEYFAKEDIRLRLGLKKTITHTQEEIDLFTAIAKRVGSERLEVGESLHALGFAPNNVEILPLIPMLEVAWADDKMSFDESRLILDTARARGLSATTPAYAKLKALTDAHPTDAFFDATNRILSELLMEHDGAQAAQERSDLLALMNRVATISGGFFGFGKSVSDDEKAVIADLVQQLGLKA